MMTAYEIYFASISILMGITIYAIGTPMGDRKINQPADVDLPGGADTVLPVTP